jgi:16S rRNA (uracil1498-N3)-methyltransferase
VPRLYVETGLEGSEISLSSRQAHYLRDVLRLRSGNDVVVFDGKGNECLAEIGTHTRDGAKLRVTSTRAPLPEPELNLTLLQGMAKADAMDLIIQKATELGVRSIAPVITEYSVVKIDAQRIRRRLEHWHRVANSACEQSGRHSPPSIYEPQPLERGLETLSQTDTRIVLDPKATGSLTDGPSSGHSGTSVCLLIGPEGGLSERDFLLADKAGFERVKLGPRILRVETAAIAACTIAQANWGDLLETRET